MSAFLGWTSAHSHALLLDLRQSLLALLHIGLQVLEAGAELFKLLLRIVSFQRQYLHRWYLREGLRPEQFRQLVAQMLHFFVERQVLSLLHFSSLAREWPLGHR